MPANDRERPNRLSPTPPPKKTMPKSLKYIERDILHAIQDAPAGGLRRPQIHKLLPDTQAELLDQAIDNLCENHKITRTAGNKFERVRPSQNDVTGSIQINLQGCGFVRRGSGQQDVFIPPAALDGILTGDTVKVRITNTSDGRGPVGEIIERLDRKHQTIVGCLTQRDQQWLLHPLRRELPDLLVVLDNDKNTLANSAHEGDWISADMLPETGPDGRPQVRIATRMAASGNVTADLNAIVKEFDIPKKYSPAFEKMAANITPADVPREDFTTLATVTIDPVDARDFDDALSYREEPGSDECTVSVHIADVACFVQPGQPLDKAARERGFTSYLPGRTLPMLPAALANDLCSLRAELPRLAHTVHVRIHKPTGQILSWRRCHTTIRVTQRLSYDDVARFFAGEIIPAKQEVLTLLANLRFAAAALRHHRETSELFLPMDIPEIRVLCSENPPRIMGVSKSDHNEAHTLVEEFMLAANQCVARELKKLRIPALYRNHLQPENENLDDFARQAETILQTRIKSFKKRKDLVDFLRKLHKHPQGDLLAMLFLRQLPRASYGAQPEGHYGLGKDDYCHFTSPIRRYPDTLVHQQLLAWDRKTSPRSLEDVQSAAQLCSAQEENSDNASYAAADRMKLRYLLELQEKGEVTLQLQGFVAKVQRWGVTVFLPDYGLMGAFDISALRDPDWRLFETDGRWKNRQTGQCLELRSRQYFIIRKADPVRGELQLLPVLEEPRLPALMTKKNKKNKKNKFHD